jgi:hypothetical protein
MGADRAAVAARTAGVPPRGFEHDPLRADHRLPVAHAAEGPHPQEHGARLLRRLALGRHARAYPCSALCPVPGGGGQATTSDPRHRRQPEREERRKRGQRIDSVGYDGGKKIKGKKRHAAVDTLGLMIGLIVTPADIQDRNVIAPVLKMACKLHPAIAKAMADGGYQGAETAAEVQAEAGIPLEIVKRSDDIKGFKVVRKR